MGVLVQGTLVNTSSVLKRNQERTATTSIVYCAPDKDPCSSNPCSQAKECYAHPYNQGYDCDCAFGYYGDECQKNGKMGGILDNEGKLLLFKMPTFELEHEILIAPPDPMIVQYKFYTVYDRLNDLVYVAANDVFYRGRPRASGHFERFNNFTEMYPGKGRSILLGNNSTWLYLGNSDSGLITRHQLPDMLHEETIYHGILNTRPTPEDTPIHPGPFVMAISHIRRLLFWIDSKGIMSCTVDDCMNTADRVHLFSEEKYPAGVARCSLVVEDKIGKIFWSDYLSTEEGYPQDILMADLDGKRVQTVWKRTSNFKLMVFTIWNDWLVAYEFESFRFWMSRFRSHIAESSNGTALPWKWFQSTFQGIHYITEMVSV
ncbi:uncharacterized protein LOC121426722 [Lytechinus variegatus]|uniref:uncharacterized protein LOC121426722 n=2 Tax=Lytechinus variegatus TaxID=7654 RepID=UPI001BB254C3|nr:uncharacterized protein LOC121426722 [Lytechinus variegatus]